MAESEAITDDRGEPTVQKPPVPPRFLVPLTFVTPKEQKTESRVQLENPSRSETDESTDASEENTPKCRDRWVDEMFSSGFHIPVFVWSRRRQSGRLRYDERTDMYGSSPPYKAAVLREISLASRSDVPERSTATTTLFQRNFTERRSVTVHIKIVFLKVGEIDTIKEHYNADIFLQARWRDPSLDGATKKDSDKVDWSNIWTPRIHVQNALGEPKISTWREIKTDESGHAYVLEKRRLAGTFAENLELKQFPFDTQDLSVFVISELPEAEVDLVEEDKEMSIVNAQSFIDAQEWKLYEHIESFQQPTSKEFVNSRYKHSGILLQCRASRKPGFFMWNILLITALICTLSFCTFAVSRDKPQNRLQLSFTLVLTAVAFKFVLSQSLPKISYLTYLDVYVLLSMVLLYVVCIWHAVISFATTDVQLAEKMDFIAFIVLIACYSVCQISFVINVYFQALRRRRTMNQKDSAYREKARRLFGGEYNEKRKSMRSFIDRRTN